MDSKPKLFRIDYGWMQFWRVSPIPRRYMHSTIVRTRWDAAHAYARALNDRRRVALDTARALRVLARRLARTYA